MRRSFAAAHQLVLLIGMGATSVGCATASLSSAGSHVAMVGAVPGRCESLGILTGKGGGSFGGGYIANDSLVEYALNDLRNQAAARGATHLRQQGVSFGSSDGTTTTATVLGEAYRCRGERALAPRPATSRQPPVATPGPAQPDVGADKLRLQLSLKVEGAEEGKVLVAAFVREAGIETKIAVKVSGDATRVVGKVCDSRFELDASERGKLPGFVVRVKEEQALQAPADTPPPEPATQAAGPPIAE